VLAVASPWAAAAQRTCTIVVVKSWDLPEYNEALDGFFAELASHDYTCETTSFNLRDQHGDGAAMISAIKTRRPDLILTIGSRATAIISQNFKDIPVVFTMVLYPVASEFVSSMDRPGKNVTGAALDVPIEQQLRLLSRIVPDLKRVGVLYDPAETLPVIKEARRVSSGLGLDLLAEQVRSESDVPEALDRLNEQGMDALWSVADGKVFTPPSTRYIIKYVVRRGIPFMGPHNGFVKAGALVALTADYRDSGRQAGEIAVRIFAGSKPTDIAVAVPQDIHMGLNMQVANHIRLRIPPDIVDKASPVFE
jgi:putative ABC transport system substrate-binding protein